MAKLKIKSDHLGITGIFTAYNVENDIWVVHSEVVDKDFWFVWQDTAKFCMIGEKGRFKTKKEAVAFAEYLVSRLDLKGNDLEDIQKKNPHRQEVIDEYFKST